MSSRPATAADLIRRCRAAGVRLALAGDRIDFDAPPAALPLVEALRPIRDAVMAELRREAARQDWQATVRDVGSRWDALFASAGDRAPWIDDEAPCAAVRVAILSGDLARAREAIAAWRAAWTAALEAGKAAAP